MAHAIDIMNGCSLNNKAHHEHLPKKTKVNTVLANHFEVFVCKSVANKAVIKVNRHMHAWQRGKMKARFQLHTKIFKYSYYKIVLMFY